MNQTNPIHTFTAYLNFSGTLRIFCISLPHFYLKMNYSVTTAERISFSIIQPQQQKTDTSCEH